MAIKTKDAVTNETVTAQAGALRKAVSQANRAVATRTPLPILKAVLVEADAKGWTVTGTNLEQWITVFTPEECEGRSFVAAVPSANLLGILDKLPADAEITLSVNDHALSIKARGGKYRLNGYDPEEYPRGHGQEAVQEWTSAPCKDMLAGVAKTIYAVSDDDARAILTGLLFTPNSDGALRLVATDTHRLTIYETESAPMADLPPVVVPGEAIKHLPALIAASDAQGVKIATSKQFAVFSLECDDGAVTRLQSCVIDGVFPSYERVVPDAHDHEILIGREEYHWAVSRLMVLAPDSRRVFHTIEEGDTLVLSVNALSGTAEERLVIEVHGDPVTPFEFRLNGKYLLQLLSALDGERAEVRFVRDALRPFVFRGAAECRYRVVQMPMQRG